MTATSILVVEDDESTRYLCQTLFEKEGHRVVSVENGCEALAVVEVERFELVVLDLNLPDGDGMEVARILHNREIPTLMMTVRGDVHERVAGFEAGAVDYLVKPFHPQELVYRVRHALERCEPGDGGREGLVRIGEWWLDLGRRTLESGRRGRADLTHGEFELLAALVRAHGRAVCRDHLLDVVSRSEGEGHPRTVDVLVSRLRRKLEADPRNPVHIVTVAGVGYRLEG